MNTCRYCGNSFDKYEAMMDFMEKTYLLSYANFRVPLCSGCAVEAIEEGDLGVYFEKCDRCKKVFDLAEEEALFHRTFPEGKGKKLRYFWNKKVLCAQCAGEDIK